MRVLNEADRFDATSGTNEIAHAVENLRLSILQNNKETAAELTIIRRVLETSLDTIDRFTQPTDHSRDISLIIQNLTNINEQLDTVQEAPLLTKSPEYFVGVVRKGGEQLIRETSTQLHAQTQELRNTIGTIRMWVQSARSRNTQTIHLGVAGLFGFVAASLMLLFLPQVLGTQIQTTLAAIILAEDKWDGGSTMMKAYSYAGWSALFTDHALVNDNRKTIEKCRAQVKTTGKHAKCEINVGD